ncbi:hypothetical protein GH714_001355 [Hevea brasiliensis]|uniref:Armadillo repeat-containing domain-containing protein n=1 Tax=Hevea brasiliensis TaxID=3981 RepID=A0A6A6L8D3_HEVBR|nr:hypothetical protein GH714_001355 [Hevea brasiliensis]
MSKSPSLGLQEDSSSIFQSRGSNGMLEMDDLENTVATVARFIEKLHAKISSPHEKELITARLVSMAKAKKEARTIIGSHTQAMPLFISILRSGTTGAKVNVAETLSALCKDDDLRVKVLLEGVVPTLWDQLNPQNKQDKVVEGFVTGALRNLCGDKDDYWRATLEAGGVDMIVGFLSSDNAAAQSNAASLLARLMLAFSDSIPRVIDSGAIKALLQLVGQNNDVSVRASAADALEVVSSKSVKAKQAVVDANGVHVLIGAVSPRLAAPVADIVGALAYALMVFEQNSGVDEESFDATKIEDILVKLLKPRDSKLIQERILEAMASLYGNIHLSRSLDYAEAKKVLIGLITMAVGDAHEYLIISLTSLCLNDMGIWEAIGKREGIQLLISLLGLSSEQHQEYAVQLLAILTDRVDDSKWAITAAGGIPPLVQLLETGSQKAREDAAHVLWNLCCHSEDIRACVESSGAIPAFLWLLKSGGPKGQEASAKALKMLVRTADHATINQLLALLLGDSSGSKANVIRVLGHVLTMASLNDIVVRGSAANKALKSLIQVLNSSNEETQEHAASILADLFSTRQDICDSLAADEIMHPCMKLLTCNNTQVVATQLARTLSALSRPTKTKSINKMPYIAEGDVKPLIKLAKTSTVDAAETAVAALANLLSDPKLLPKL